MAGTQGLKSFVKKLKDNVKRCRVSYSCIIIIIIIDEKSAFRAGCRKGRRFLGAVGHLAQHKAHFRVKGERVQRLRHSFLLLCTLGQTHTQEV